MKNIPRLRRHPRPPALQTTSLNKPDPESQAGTNTAPSSTTSAESARSSFQQEPHQTPEIPQSDSTSDNVTRGARSSSPSPFRSFRLRGTAKRMKSSLTSASARHSTPPTEPSSPHEGPQPKHPKDLHNQTPGFLLLSKQGMIEARRKACFWSETKLRAHTIADIEKKFQEIQWAERSRIALATLNESIPDFRWGSYKHSTLPKSAWVGQDRYFNIKPWNHNRVRLQVSPEQIDYVNASTVDIPQIGPVGDNETSRYIAMQGPTTSSIPYVWRMMAEQSRSSIVIVQLTNFVEAGGVKCDHYFPDEESTESLVVNTHDVWKDGWNAQLSYVNNSFEKLEGGTIEKRQLRLHLMGEEEPRVVWHLLYTKWPDSGVPDTQDLDGFLKIIYLSRQYSDPSSPRFVHCSAGVGRTGTFISLDWLLRQIETGDLYNSLELDDTDVVSSLVEGLRESRRGMVQSEAQFRYLYATMRILWQRRYGKAQKHQHEPNLSTSDGDEDPFSGPQSPQRPIEGGSGLTV